MDAVIEKNPKLTRAEELFKRFTENEELNRYEAKVKYERDLRYWAECYAEEKYSEAREEGISIGEKRGRNEAKLETAKVLKTAGIEMNLIIDSTGLSPEEIKKL